MLFKKKLKTVEKEVRNLYPKILQNLLNLLNLLANKLNY